MKIDEIKIKREENSAQVSQPKPARTSRLSKKEKFLIGISILVLIVGYFSYQSFAGTSIGISLKKISTLSGTPDINSGLQGWWTFDGQNLQSKVGDASGQGNTGYLTNFTSTTTIPGVLGQALLFNGTNQYVISNTSSLTLS